MSRCSICHNRIWPWQHLGFRVEARGRRYWHTSCAAGLGVAEVARSPTRLTEHEPLPAGRAVAAAESRGGSARNRD